MAIQTDNTTACGHRMAHRKEIEQQPTMLPGPAVPGCSLVSFHILWAILCPQAVHCEILPTWRGLQKLDPSSWP